MESGSKKRKAGKKDKWKFALTFSLLSVASLFLYIGREKTTFFIIGCVVFVISLIAINWIDKKSRN